MLCLVYGRCRQLGHGRVQAVITDSWSTAHRCCLHLISGALPFWTLSFMPYSVNYSRRRIALAISQDCYILPVLFLFYDYGSRFFHVSNRFSRNFANRGGMFRNNDCPVGILVLPVKIWGAKTPNFRQFVDLKSTLWAPPFHNAREIGKSKTVGVNLWLGYDRLKCS